MSRRVEFHQVEAGTLNVRLSDYIGSRFMSIPSRKGMKKAIDKGWVKVNDVEATTATRVFAGDRLELSIPAAVLPEKAINLQVIYEDEHLAVVLKPHGMLTSGNARNTLDSALLLSLKPTKEADALPGPHPAHRLDKDTAGLVLVGKTATCLQALNRMFESREVKKTYRAIVSGRPDARSIEIPIEGKPAMTRLTVLESVSHSHYGTISCLELHPLTGRTHQLRIHLSSIGHPILGDKIYGDPNKMLRGKGLFLCATGLEFLHPLSSEHLNIHTEPTPKFQAYLHPRKRN